MTNPAGIILYFPWGGAGNLIKNIINMDTRFEFLDYNNPDGVYKTVESRYNFLLDYYTKPVAPSDWLPREWSIRSKFYNRYYVSGNSVYWNPDNLLTYDCHGGGTELENILSNNKLKHWNRYAVSAGLMQEQLSPWTLLDCTHIFLIPSDTQLITDIYYSKNPTINQFLDYDNIADRKYQADLANAKLTNDLVDHAEKLRSLNKVVYQYDSLDLYKGTTCIDKIVESLELVIPSAYYVRIHDIWLQSTKKIYYNHFNKELTL